MKTIINHKELKKYARKHKIKVIDIKLSKCKFIRGIPIIINDELNLKSWGIPK